MLSINIALKYISMWEKHFVSIVTLHVYIPIIGMILTNTSLEYILTVREVSSINDERY